MAIKIDFGPLALEALAQAKKPRHADYGETTIAGKRIKLRFGVPDCSGEDIPWTYVTGCGQFSGQRLRGVDPITGRTIRSDYEGDLPNYSGTASFWSD